MSILYKSTRGKDDFITASEAIIKGMAENGGLYVPNEIPRLECNLKDFVSMDFRELAYFIVHIFFPDFQENTLKDFINKAYDNKFDSDHITPLVEKADSFFLELFHGPTLAFKDVALSLLPYLLKGAAEKEGINKKIVILTATSGDTGKAALQAFAGIQGVNIIVFYPKDGVSQIQKLQMVTQQGDNTFVIGVEGNFDDAQTGVKNIFNDTSLGKKLEMNKAAFSSANSINIGRLVPQIVYYFYSYLTLLKEGKINENEKINFVVPTGNFGNILAGYYAKKMGLPVNKLICASNENNVLTDFLNSGVYDKNRPFKVTSSPSMDILISSNLERFIYEICDRDDTIVEKLMEQLKTQGSYKISDGMGERMKDFYGGFATEEETFSTIKELFDDEGYVIDTHTAVAYEVYKQYKAKTGDLSNTVILSTASPFKFTKNVCDAIGIYEEGMDDFKCAERLSKAAGIPIPEQVKNLKNKKILHTRVCAKYAMKETVEKILGV
ncbi:MAG: thrC [Clostridiaceae bacterium]|nr:thrC [Clostridiaceae bacterium]